MTVPNEKTSVKKEIGSYIYEFSDPFEGLREFPRTSSQLRNHLSSIHHTLQSNFFVDSETSHLSLQPQMKKEFYCMYREEVEKIFRHLSRVTQRSIKVRVDPFRSKRGYEVKAVKLSPSSSAPTQECLNIKEDPAWVEKMSILGRKLQDAERLNNFMDRTPEKQAIALKTSTIDSAIRLHQNSDLFCTPPEFKGFKKLEIGGS